MRYFIALLLIALPVVAQQFTKYETGGIPSSTLTVNTNVYLATNGDIVLPAAGGIHACAVVQSPTNVADSVTFYFGTTVDGTNWSGSNAVLVLTAPMRGNTNTGYVTCTNFTADQIGAASGFRLIAVKCSTVTNMLITNLTYGTWR